MAGKRDGAWIADQICTVLKEHVGAKLTEFASDYIDGLILQGIDNTNYHVSQRMLIDGYPIVCVVPMDADAMPLDGYANYHVETHNLVVAIALTLNEGEDDLKRRTARTLRAIRSILREHFTLDGTVDQIQTGSEEYGPMLAGEDALLQEAQLAVRVRISADA